MVRFKHRYLLCELVSDDPRCRLSLEDRVLGGLFRDTIARVHGTFGAAACSVGFAGTIRTCQKFLIQYNRRQLLILLQNCTDEGEREAIQKSVTRSCLLEDSGEEELSDSGGEEAAEAME
ncbi:ribonuclease P/MRP protein subunit POP5 isoform X2 [Marmota marmota marmota]|uniref:ribonuclease P/MRP protein subunit POP5 isoform X2 n=1 Tax=Urocitellus parryii TaxID=9999 RepID=UPI000E55A63D|nr:ribonuclease P/MRP protein subunit POP5 isoform X2 [Urocitellus parryii]XP_048641645.1 ribonuclease P/MRP protein subunit POP5 isoform X2 [Marmota marmota marmota]